MARLLQRSLDIWQTATFRFTIGLTLIFAVGSAILLLLLNFAVMRFSENELNEALQHQMAIMRADVNLEGGGALASVLQEHSRADVANRYRFRVVETGGQTFAYGLDDNVERIHGFGTVPVPHGGRARNDDHHIRVLTEVAADGTFMAVGRDTAELEQLHDGLNLVAMWGSLALFLFAMTAGTVTGYLFLRRIDQVNTAAAQIIDTNLKARLPAIGFGREFGTLATNLNRMLDRLEAALESMRQVSSDLAHDLRTPLTRLRAQLENATAAPARNKAAAIQAAMDETDEMLRLFNALLRLSQIASGDARRAFKDIALSELVLSVAETYRPAIEESGRSLMTSVSPDVSVRGDAVLLGQVVTNLLDNTLLHTPTGTQIHIGLIRTHSCVQIEVSDTGPGIPDDQRDLVAKRFFRLDSSRSVPGHGLGLSLVKAIVELHDGQFTLRSNSPGLRVRIDL